MSLGRPELIEPNEIPNLSSMKEPSAVARQLESGFHLENPS